MDPKYLVLGALLGGVSGAVGYGLSQSSSSSAQNMSAELIDGANKGAASSLYESGPPPMAKPIPPKVQSKGFDNWIPKIPKPF